MSDQLSPQQLRVESQLRMQRALELIERAQNDLNSACAELSTLVGGVPVWRATGKLADRVRALWYRVEAFRQRGRFHLDDTTVAAILRRESERRAPSP